ncbi:YncE family protein [Metallosphaera tengchongensis]|uniref:YncE family protein n=1 Tax=Metallosphaera tengchongensis TaxID=1532350 RepID=A0A6N0NYI2_9CREN|nr:YncE family protein [Metallosphaera tengchongensis]QKR00160.1 YncE family protein [Metallosphaera tengchongensis]
MNYKVLLIVGIVVILLVGIGAAYIMMKSSTSPSSTSTTTTTTPTSSSNTTSTSTSTPNNNFYFLALTQKGIAQVLNPFSSSQNFLGFTRVVNISTSVPTQVYYWEEVEGGANMKVLFMPLNNGTVFVINTTTFKVVKTLEVGSSVGFIGVSISPNGQYAAIADGPSGVLEVINTQTLQTVWSQKFVSPTTGKTYYPCDVRWTPDGSSLVVPMRFNNSVDLISASNGTVLVVRPTSLGSQPYMVSPNQQGTMVAVEFAGNNSVGFYSLPSLQYLGMVQMPKGLTPQRGVFTPSGQYYLEAPSNNDTVVVISTSNFQIVKEIPLPQITPAGLADIEITPGGSYAYVVIHGSVQTGGMIVLISLSSLSVSTTLPLTTAPAIVIPISQSMGTYLVNQVMLPPVTGLHC